MLLTVLLQRLYANLEIDCYTQIEFLSSSQIDGVIIIFLGILEKKLVLFF